MHEPTDNKPTDMRTAIQEAVAHLEHILPGQAPIKDFVHHNTLHGYQHLPFPDAIKEARKSNGNSGYLPIEQFRQFFASGRISNEDLEVVLLEDEPLAANEAIAGEQASEDSLHLRRLDIYKAAMLYSLKPITNTQLNWQIQEWDCLHRFQTDVNRKNRRRLLNAAQTTDEATAISHLWRTCLQVFGLQHYLLHPEELLDLGQEDAQRIFSELTTISGEVAGEKPMVHRLVRKEAERTLQNLIEQIGTDLTLSGFLKLLTNIDLLEDMRPVLIRHVNAYLDYGIAAWRNPDSDKGFYAAWRRSADRDLAWPIDNIYGVKDALQALPDDPLEAVMGELQHLGLPRSRWASYLQRLALEIPGWSGMFYWHQQHPGYADAPSHPVNMMDYLAVRLVFERLSAQRLCREQWNIEPRLDTLQAHFRRHRSEFIVRYLQFNSRLPEYIVNLAQRLVGRTAMYKTRYAEWISLADLIWTWRNSPAADRPVGHSVYRSAWRLFRLAQHLGLSGQQISTLEKTQIDQVFACLDSLDDESLGYLWLRAYERNYREQLLNAVVNNQDRGRWSTRIDRPLAQVVFCMDDREEGFRRHLEEINPDIETLGAAGFFGVAINWRALDDTRITPLCPIVVTPAHEVREQPQSAQQSRKQHHDGRRGKRLWLKNYVHQELRLGLLNALLFYVTLAPLTLLVMLGKLLAPILTGRWSRQLQQRVDLTVATEVLITAQEPAAPATPEHPRLGFTDHEQADRVESFLRSIGLTTGFGTLVVLMGHGSSSQNNPHLAAYDCGACSGRHGGPNARVFAAMANRSPIRKRLRHRGINIPEDTWFLGAEHNTCDESITWFDQDVLPIPLQEEFDHLQKALRNAALHSAHERCRRLASAPNTPSLTRALQHMVGRSFDFSQVRPELGHATNAAAFIGRRAMSQGLFLDRRVFLISYDPTQDAQGTILEAILLAVGPVGAGINLEYYFSTVNNEQYGCGSKITHNIAGLFGVMDGTSSDLRTGLPKQMIEIHEAMRLQIVVEATVAVLSAIIERQPPLQELIGNEWVHLIAKDPDSKAVYLFKPTVGFVPWQGSLNELPKVAQSRQWYSGHSGPVGFALSGEATHGG
jgi:uncharacterized protein YbcC (UPF0753/DUF2309 family)